MALKSPDTSVNFRGHQNNAVLQVKPSENGEFGRRNGQSVRLMFSVTNIMIGIDFKFTANKEKI